MAKKTSDGSGGDGWIYLLLGAVGGALATYAAIGGSNSEEAPPKEGIHELMVRLVRDYRVDKRIRSFIGRLIGAISGHDDLGRIEAIYRYIADHIAFVHDPGGEYVSNPVELLETRVGDCDCKATALATLLEAAGFPTNFVFIPRHVYVEVGLDLEKQKFIPQQVARRTDQNRVWIPLESTATGGAMGWVSADVTKAIRDGSAALVPVNPDPLQTIV